MKRSACLLLLTACLSIGNLAWGQEFKSPCQGHEIRIRKMTICERLALSPPAYGMVATPQWAAMSSLYASIIGDLKSLAIVSDDARNLLEKQNDPNREKVARELHHEITEIEGRNEYRGLSASPGTDSILENVRDSDLGNLTFLHHSIPETIGERTNSRLDVRNYRDRILALHKIADDFCRRNRYPCKEPRKKHFLFF